MKLGLGGTLTMIILSIAIGVLLNMQIVGAQNGQSFVPNKTPHEIEAERQSIASSAQMSAKSAVSSAYMWMVLGWGMVALVLSAGGAAVLRFLWIPAIKFAKTFFPDESGRLPVVIEKVRDDEAPFFWQMLGQKKVIHNDLQLAMMPTTEQRTIGGLRVVSNSHGVDNETQARYAMKQLENDKVTAAIAKGSTGRVISPRPRGRAELEHEAGIYQERAQNERIRGEIGKVTLQERLRLIDERTRPVADPLIEEQSIALLTFQQALDQSTRTNWILGQALESQPTTQNRMVDKAPGSLISFNPQNDRIAILGASGQGKTESTGIMMIACARKAGYHCIVLDGKGGVDWREFDGVVEWCATDGESIHGYISQITAIYNERSLYLESNLKLKTIYADPESRYQPLLIVLEEWGDVWSHYRSSHTRAEAAELQSQIDRLYRKGRMCGIVVCIIDQAPEKWSAQMRGNSTFSIVYKIGGSVAADFREYHTHKLSRGQFSNGDVFYGAWHAAVEIDLHKTYRDQPIRMLASGTKEQTESAPSAPVALDSSTIIDLEATEVSQYREQITVLPIPLRKIYDRCRDKNKDKWKEFSIKYRSIYPDGSIIELSEAMSLAEVGVVDMRIVDARKSQAKKWLDLIDASASQKRVI